MKSDLAKALFGQRGKIRARWLEILLADSVVSPLANPHTLCFLMDDTLDAVFATLRRRDVRGTLDAPVCACGRNPYLAYFRAGTQALFEALVQIQAEMTNLEPVQRVAAFQELSLAINGIAIEEIETLGSLCTHHDRARQN